MSGLARGLAEELGCAVVAMRYPVRDEFSIAFNQVFYERMLSGGDPAGMASARALAAVLAGVSAGGPVSGGSAIAVTGKAALPGIPAASLGVFGDLPYLTRHRDWDSAAALLDDAIRHGALPAGNEDGYLPELQQVARFTDAPAVSAALALATQSTDRAEACRLLEDSLGRAESAGDYSLAWPVAGHLADALRDAGHPDQALDVITRQEQYAQAAGLGPWTKLAGQGRRLAILARMGQNGQVLAEMIGVRDRMHGLTEEKTSRELPSIAPWAVRERILDTGRACALAFGKWHEALDAGAEIQGSRRRRGASRHELAVTRFFDAYPLIRSHRLTEAARLLVECQQVFEDDGDTGNLSHVFTERADLEAALDHADDAVRFARSALRMTYTKTIPDPIAAAHQRLARYLRNVGAPAEEHQAHWLAAAPLYRLGKNQALDELMLSVPPGLRAGQGLRLQPGTADPHPWTLAEVIDAAEQTNGVHLAELITAMEPDTNTVTRTLTAILDSAAGQDVAAVPIRATGRQLLANFGGYELATDPGVASLVNRFRRRLESQAGQEQEPEAGSLHVHGESGRDGFATGRPPRMTVMVGESRLAASFREPADRHCD